MLLRTIEVGDRHDVLRAARELDELGQDAASGDVERQVDAVGSERANPLDEALAVGDGLGAQRRAGSRGWRGWRCRSRARRAATASWTAALPTLPDAPLMSSVLPPLDAELVEGARGRLDGGRQRGRAGEVKRRRDRRIVGQHRQLGLGRPVGGEAEHAITDGHIRDALTDLVDDAGRLVAQGLRELADPSGPGASSSRWR